MAGAYPAGRKPRRRLNTVTDAEPAFPFATAILTDAHLNALHCDNHDLKID
jgi:hypothetical protein